ncbi:MAG: hypothetical protein ACI93S_000170 [Ancylomarina sp.]|jgi:hypothetical protein
MGKSIEEIWKEGFLKSDALVAPKLNNLYNQKSTHIVDKFKRMFKINLYAIVIGSLVFLIASFPLDIPLMGIGYFFVLIAMVLVNQKLFKSLIKLDKNQSSYDYIKAFDNWMKEQMNVNARMAQYYYPLFFLFMMLGFWFSENFQEMIQEILGKPHQIYLVNGIPVFWVSGLIIITGLLAYFGKRIYKFDVGLVYGRELKKLNELIADMEELRK